MQNVMVFSHHKQPKCLSFYRDQLIIVSNSNLCLFDVGQAKLIYQLPFKQEIMPIMIWVMENQNVAILQGKMGWNFVFQLNPLGTIEFLRKYRTGVNGFCKMSRYDRALWGVSEDMQGGELLAKGLFDEEEHCQSITCLEIQGGPVDKKDVGIYLAQEGSIIRKFGVSHNIKESNINAADQLALHKNNDTDIISSLVIVDRRMYCILRKCACLFVLKLDPQMELIQSTDIKLMMPKHLLFSKFEETRLTFMVADQNKIKKISTTSSKTQTVAQFHQSKSIQHLECSNSGVCGCTGEDQFFYLEPN